MELNQRKCVEGSKQRGEECEGRHGNHSSLFPKNFRFSFPQSFKVKNELPLRPIFLSFFLFMVGSSFLYLGVTLLLSKKFPDSAPSLLLGIFCFIPGTYYSFSILQILRGVPGYSFEQLDIS